MTDYCIITPSQNSWALPWTEQSHFEIILQQESELAIISYGRSHLLLGAQQLIIYDQHLLVLRLLYIVQSKNILCFSMTQQFPQQSKLDTQLNSKMPLITGTISSITLMY